MTKTVKALRISLITAGAFLALVVVSSAGIPQAHAALTSQMSVGSTGGDVTQLQQFLATNSQIYPSGIVSGYYGSLTKAAVTQFQVAYGISQVGQVGPITEAKVNSIMASGFGLNTNAATLSNLSVQQINPTTATINWTTSEPAVGQVFYSTSPILANEATGVYQIPYIGGTPSNVNSDPSVSNNHSIQLNGLQPNTFYYFIVRSIDNSLNVSMSQSLSFQTN